MRDVSPRCGGQFGGSDGYTTGQVGDILSELKAQCDHKFKKKDMRKKVCKGCVKKHGHCKLTRSITPATGEPSAPGCCLNLSR